MYNEAVRIESRLLAHVLDRFNEAVPMHPHLLEHVPDPLKTMEMCNEVKLKIVHWGGFEVDPWKVHHVPDRFKTQRMCNTAVELDAWLFNYAPDWLATHKWVKIWHDEDDFFDDEKIIEWYDGYKNAEH